MEKNPPIDRFLDYPGDLFDVRSPKEFAKGHIPCAVNLPLFSDQEREDVGKQYKKKGKEKAIELGLKIVGPKLSRLALLAKEKSVGKCSKIYCWRGGMRSASVGWLLDLMGKNTLTLKGGYKSFRKWVSKIFHKTYKIYIIGGMAGSGKTRILRTLHSMGEQVLDLESLAKHRGSSYGSLGKQPTNEQFENNLALQWISFDSLRPIWIENESRTIGSCVIPEPLFEKMRTAKLIQIEIPLNERLRNLRDDYKNCSADFLLQATESLCKRLGGLRTNQIKRAVLGEDYMDAYKIALEYYDKAYYYDLKRKKRNISLRISYKNLSSKEWAKKILSSIPPAKQGSL